MREDFEELKENAIECFVLLQKIECKDKLIDDKANLIIEANSIVKKITELLQSF